MLPEQVIVVDQGGHEDVERVVERHRRDGCTIVLVRNQERGLSASRNAAVRAAPTPYLAVTDDDCVPGPRWVETIGRAFSGPARPAAVTGPVLPLGPGGADRVPVSSRTSLVARTFRGRRAPWQVGTGANFAVCRPWLDRVGAYDVRLGAGSSGGAGEDIDLIYRLLRAGGSIRYEPDALIHHERATVARRRATRSTYGAGVGAFCGLHLRRRDGYALVLLLRWLGLRARLCVASFVRKGWRGPAEEVLVLAGTAHGLVYGLRARRHAGSR